MINDKLSLQELANALSEKQGIYKKDAELFVRTVFDIVATHLKEEKSVKIKGFGTSVKDAVKKAFGIESPSKVMRDEVGKYLAEGIGVGFTQEMQTVSQQMQNAIPRDFNTSITTANAQQAASIGYADMVNAFKEALYQVKIEMDDVAMGHFIDKTMTSLVYT